MGSVVDRRNDAEVESEIVIPNPTDREAIAVALGGTRTDALEDRFVIFLAGSHPYRDRLFEPAAAKPVLLGPFQETLQSKAGRYVYRVQQERHGRPHLCWRGNCKGDRTSSLVSAWGCAGKEQPNDWRPSRNAKIANCTGARDNTCAYFQQGW